jgi:hypothetical protein
MKRFIKNYTITTLVLIAISLLALLFAVILEALLQLKILFSQAMGLIIINNVNIYYNWAKTLCIFIISNLIFTAIYTILIGVKYEL